jgi:hypothetical protein
MVKKERKRKTRQGNFIPMLSRRMNTYGVGSTTRYFEYTKQVNTETIGIVPLSFVVSESDDAVLFQRYRFFKLQWAAIVLEPLATSGRLSYNFSWVLESTEMLADANDATKYLYVHAVKPQIRKVRPPNSNIPVDKNGSTTNSDYVTYNYRQPLPTKNYVIPGRFHFKGTTTLKVTIIVKIKFIGEKSATESALKLPIDMVNSNRAISIPESKFGPVYANNNKALEKMKKYNKKEENIEQQEQHDSFVHNLKRQQKVRQENELQAQMKLLDMIVNAINDKFEVKPKEKKEKKIRSETKKKESKKEDEKSDRPPQSSKRRKKGQTYSQGYKKYMKNGWQFDPSLGKGQGKKGKKENHYKYDDPWKDDIYFNTSSFYSGEDLSE